MKVNNPNITPELIDNFIRERFLTLPQWLELWDSMEFKEDMFNDTKFLSMKYLKTLKLSELIKLYKELNKIFSEG